MIENVLGGKIWIESTPGAGTTVSFTLSFQKAPKDSSVPNDMKIAAKDPDPMANWSQAASPDTEQKNISFCDLTKVPREELRVCIAEDNQINRKIAISFVKKIGLNCEAYEDGKQAYDALKAKSKEGNPFHLVLMDVQMPVLDGYEATKAIRADPDPNVNQVLIIAMTASAIRGDREKCLEAGMNDYLAKPVRQTALKAMLDDYLNNPKLAATNGSPTVTTPGDKANGPLGEDASKPAETMGNGDFSSSAGEKPKSSRPFRRVMKKVDTSVGEKKGEPKQTNSPPSGKRETDELGKVSNENVPPKEQVLVELSAVDGNGGLNGPKR
jgi:CheY-like chemotaxis protein